MEVRNCKTCGALYNHVRGMSICPSCERDLEKKYEEVKEYIYDNPKVSMQKVAEENDVSIAQIKKWVKEERLEFTEDSAIFIECEKCGKAIRTGRFCQGCKDSMSSQLGGIYQEKKKIVQNKPKRAESNKMRFLDS